MEHSPRPVILCVDDEPFILNSLGRTFRRDGYTVHRAGTGPEALQLLDQQHVDLVIADHHMPGMSGEELLDEVHARFPGVILFMLSGFSVNALPGSEAGRGHVERYMPKPWRNQELRDAVRLALAARDDGEGEDE